jgi:hypothetical protein
MEKAFQLVLGKTYTRCVYIVMEVLILQKKYLMNRLKNILALNISKIKIWGLSSKMFFLSIGCYILEEEINRSVAIKT